ncbi:hypothetical protein Smp_170630 [Schistosoma mansoni]|uniref:hypothetical protein n=1 Tax=Schistosoma mansoni TaxID=6183 RepID=UPI00022DC385|nr:hypothetical protein Smp_170630 [Schistosoma mansoni]|eukprot:XP_018652496.1 hypothetical protein Smp_170630 [Schistosoma mansoni]
MMMFKLWIILIHLLQYLTVIYTQYVNKEAYTCPYLWMQWKQKRTLGWICGSVSYLQTKVPGVKFENDCCPGYEKIELLDNKCAFIDRSWQPIIDQLRDQKSLQIAQSLSKGNNLQDLSSNSTKNVYTVFVPQQDDDIVSKEIDYVSDTDAVGTMVSSGRWYSKEFHNGQKIPTTKGTNIKVTTYSNGALPPTYKYPTVLKRLNAESDLTAFVQSLPQDIKRKLDEPDSIEWYTVFAVPNNIWNKITSGIVSTEIKESLARQHVMNKMICSDAIVKNTKRVGPTLAETYIGIQRNSNGNLIINDICNKQIAIQRKDLMSGTGVIHIIENSISSLESMKLNEALECLENNPSLGVKQAANEMRKCQMNLGTGRDNVILLSNDGAFQYTKEIFTKFISTNFRQQLSQHSPNVLFLAPIDLGWKTRNLENSYSVEQNRKLLQLHTIPHGFFGSDDGFIERGSVLEVESLLTDLQGKKVKLLIKRTPDGNTFVGHKDLKEELWSMVIDWNKVGEDGILWFIDWPMKCPEQLC